MSTLSFQRWLVIINGLVPGILLLWDAFAGQLGANSVNIALHITGILSLVFLFLSLLITPLRRLTNWGNWIAFRRSLGLYGFFYAVLHTLIYVVFDRAGNLSSTFQEILSRRFLQVGAMAVLLMVPLAVTSTNSMIQRIGSHRWKMLHRLTYLVAILGVLHFYMLVKSDVRMPLAFAGVLSLLLGVRAIRSQPALKKSAAPISDLQSSTGVGKSAQRWSGQLQVVQIRTETHNIRTFRLAMPQSEPIPFDFLPGQFLNLQLLIGDQRVNRSYTIASAPTQRDWIELTVKREPQGKASTFLHETVQQGDLLKVSGPAGRFVFTGQNSTSVVLIAGGVGITPVMSIIRYLTDTRWSGTIYLVLSARTRHDLIFHDELETLSVKHAALRVCITLTQCPADELWSGERGRITAELLMRFVPKVEQFPVYVCGPTEMAGSTRRMLNTLGVPEGLIHVEAFGGPKSIAGSAARDPETNSSSLLSSEQRTVDFTRSGKTVTADSTTSILELAEQSGIPLDSECRSGICGQCRVRLISGSVSMACQDALTESDRKAGIVLACQAIPTTSVSVDQ